ncbi:MAG: hypothetical protein U0W24_10085 [Bacteroidales bacterium]
MILISKIKPIGQDSYIDISSIESLYLDKFRKYSKPEQLLTNLYSRKRKEDGYVLYNPKQKEIIKYLIKHFKEILLAPPLKLTKIIHEFSVNGWNDEIKNHSEPKSVKIKRGNFREALLDVFGYDDRFRSNEYRGIWLAKQLNIKSCPYCNAQYTILVEDHTKKSIAKFQFDHFFPKNEYPYLSISLYNLIPSCANCNITKSNKPLDLSNHYHPFYNDFAIRSEFYLKYDPDPSKLTVNEVKKQNLELEFRAKPKYPDKDNLVEKHDHLYDITGVYNRHQDVAEDLLISAILYKSAAKHYASIEGLFPPNDLFKRYLIGTFPDKESILERPLTKFRQDIAKQLGLI